ncbi:MAG: transposase [Enterobacterales bacterium]|nr:transposase [Enterobacterales bacterium]
MARKPRLDLPGVTQHIIQRGNNKACCFRDDSDFSTYINWLDEAARKNNTEIHAWVLMTNHVHLLVTPQQKNASSKMMQSLGRRYVAYFNDKYDRTGTLWEGRFKSCLVESVNYVLACYRYIELNPVRANMVNSPAEYHWSSYQANAVGKDISLCSPHEEYLALGENKAHRLNRYKHLFTTMNDNIKYAEIRQSTSRGLAIGSDAFLNEIERQCQKPVRPVRPGRPRKK